MDTRTRIEATAGPNHSGPIEPAAQTPTVMLLPRLERGSRRFLAGPPRLPVPVLAPVPVKRRPRWQQRPPLQPQGLKPRQQVPATHTLCSLPGYVHAGTDNHDYIVVT